MQIEVGDLIQWRDHISVGADAGKFMLVVELVPDLGVAAPRVGVVQDGVYASWSWTVISKWCDTVLSSPAEASKCW